MKTFVSSNGKYLLAILLLGLTIGLGYFVKQADFPLIISFFASFFFIYILIYRSVTDSKTIWFYLGLGIVLRASLLFAEPNLSNDVYRFIWDGRLINQGINPFEQLPSYYIDSDKTVTGIDQTLFEKLNSPNYFTIYPPVCQAVFASACWIAPNSILASAILMKLFLFLLEIGSILLLVRLMQRLSLPLKRVLLYALNPLIILEITGNLHFEGAMIFFLLLAYWLLLKNKWQLSAIAFTFSIASKLLTLMFLPLLIVRLGWIKSIKYFSIIGLALVLLFAPLMTGVFFDNFGNSLNLYFQKFEFNASLYYVLRWIGYHFKGYNLIQILGPTLALSVGGIILTMSLVRQDKTLYSLPIKMLFAISLYLLCTTTVHPWYTAMPIVLCLFTNYRFPILWSALILLTYVNYSYGDFYENLWIVAIEYILVICFFIGEYRFKVTN